MVIVCDLDGVVWLADQPIDGAAQAVSALRAAGHTVAFASNFSDAPASALGAKLAAMGIEPREDLVTSPMAAASLLSTGERVLVLGGPGTLEAVERAGASVVDAVAVAEPEGPFDAVVVGYRRDVTWDHIRRTSTAVREGARFIATGTDATYPTPRGLVPGNGATVAAISTAAGRSPVVAGKPHEPMAGLIRARYGPTGWMVGDRPETDGAFARTLGYGWALVLSGVIGKDDLPVDPEPDTIDPSLTDFTARVLAGDAPPPG
ncbi:MAG TPA: HAD-IIA family hydrolase [Acidimicrobiales bacterium]|nr:HAD-IIA family hydrolase [Acidimicrobiales bacterium]